MIHANAEGLPLYRQISQLIESDIESGRYAVGAQLPTEHDLGRHYKVNRHTAREALRQLKDDGLAYSIRGKGTFVAHSKVLYRVARKMRFSTSVLEVGLTPGAKLISTRTEPANETLRDKLDLPKDAPLVVLEILRSVNQIPFSFAVSYLPAEHFGLMSQRLQEGFSLYALMRELYGIEVSRQSSIFEVTLPETRDAELLQIPLNVPLLTTRSLAVDQTLQPVEYCVSHMRGDMGSIMVDFSEK
ncbi:MAG: phosphonate metabolism transcriptional regulator PhnF [Desulfuromonadales bacterium]|nr:phosphonate metabolism transcriptional regulator PhnF [Desulfuromonadales bacterium]